MTALQNEPNSLGGHMQLRVFGGTYESPLFHAATRKVVPATIGMMDDDTDFLDVLEDELESEGIATKGVTTVTNLRELLEREKHLKMLLLDYHLGTTDGVAVLRSISGELERRKILPVFMSGESTVVMKARRRQLPFLEKPFDIREVKMLLDEKDALLHAYVRQESARQPSGGVKQLIEDVLMLLTGKAF